MTRFLVMIVSLILPETVSSQVKSFTIRGSVTDQNGKAVELATVSLNNAIATATDNKGAFVFRNVPQGDYTWRVSSVGYAAASGTMTVATGKETLGVTLHELSLELQGVVVTAKQVQMGSKSVIGQDAIRHIQPKSIGDMLQLVPGNLIENPDLNELAQAHIREIGTDYANAMGTAVVVDGTPLSNESNLQVMGANKYGTLSNPGVTGMSAQTTAGRGTDLRTVSAGSVESVEVIRGIPSVEYGNLTSGVVMVKTKSGRTPYEVKVQADAKSKLVYAGKGFALKGGGAMNYGIDWAQSWGDTRKHYLGYDRLTATAGYSNQWGPLSFNVRGSFYTNVNNVKTDPQMIEQHAYYKNTNTGGRLSVNGHYRNKHSFITSLDYNLSGQYSHTRDTHSNWVYNPDGVISNAREAGIHEALLKTTGYQSEYAIDGKPMNLYAQVVANKYIQLSESNYTTLKLGAEYTYDANKGKGLTYDEQNPPQASSAHTLRPRAYKDIPALRTFSAFVSDRLHARFGTFGAQLEAGVRISRLFLNSAESGGNSGYLVAEPRLNANISLLTPKNNRLVDDLSLTGGYGLSNKMPTLLYLYPDAAYYDNVSLSWNGDETRGKLALMTTDVVTNTMNPSLKPANTRKWEIGLSFRKGAARGFVTYFNESHRNEYGFTSELLWQNYYVFSIPSDGRMPAFDPQTQDVTYTDAAGATKTAGKTLNTQIFSWGRPANTTHTTKHGIEYGIDLGEWHPLRTSLSINGAWFHIKRKGGQTTLETVHSTYDYVGIAPAGEGSVRDRVNTTFRFITHIPAVRMIVTTSVQAVWHESYRNIWEDENGHPRYYMAQWSDGNQYMFVDPLGYYDKQGEYHPWQAADKQNAKLNVLMPRNMSYYYERNVVGPWAMLSFRLTKELGKTGEVSFIANNLTNTKRYHTNRHSLSRTQLYPDMYFGAELKLKL